MRSKRTLIVVLLVIATLGLLLNCGPEPQPPPPSRETPPPPSGETPPPAHPDLAIVDVKIYPSQPQAGKVFKAVVYVTNQGNTASGEFDLAMHIKDVSRSSTYPVGTFRQSALQPGDQVPWQSGDLMVNESGAHQYWVEIVPFLFEDGNEQNNTYGWAFQVAP